jgi:hypothetical protein
MEPFVFGMVLQADGKRVASVADSTLAYIGGRESPRDADIRGIQIKGTLQEDEALRLATLVVSQQALQIRNLAVERELRPGPGREMLDPLQVHASGPWVPAARQPRGPEQRLRITRRELSRVARITGGSSVAVLGSGVGGEPEIDLGLAR